MKQYRPQTKRYKLKPADVREVCHEIMAIGDGEEPISAVGWTDLKGRWRRLEVAYPNGWGLSVRFRADESVSSAKAHFKAVIKGKPKTKVKPAA